MDCIHIALHFTDSYCACMRAMVDNPPYPPPPTFNMKPDYCYYFLIHAAKAFTELTRYLLQQPGVHYVLSAKLSQDSLESFFGKQRMRGGFCDNPNVATFLYGAQSLRVQGSTAVKPTRGNCKRGRTKESIIIDEEPLPKCRRSSRNM